MAACPVVTGSTISMTDTDAIDAGPTGHPCFCATATKPLVSAAAPTPGTSMACSVYCSVLVRSDATAMLMSSAFFPNCTSQGVYSTLSPPPFNGAR